MSITLAVHHPKPEPADDSVAQDDLFLPTPA